MKIFWSRSAWRSSRISRNLANTGAVVQCCCTSARCKVWDRAGEVSSYQASNQSRCGSRRPRDRLIGKLLLQVSKHARCGSTNHEERAWVESRDVEINVCARQLVRIRTMSKDVVKVDEFEALAKKKMPKMAFDYYASGAEDEHTLQQNRDAFSRIRWVQQQVPVWLRSARLVFPPARYSSWT